MLTGIHEKLSVYNIVPVCYNIRVDRVLPALFITPIKYKLKQKGSKNHGKKIRHYSHR